MRSISGTLLTAQGAAKRTPYVHMLFTSKDGQTTRDLSLDSAAYGNRILLLDHAEEAYNEYAVVLLRNNDKTLPNLKGYWTEIGYGDTTVTGNEYAGDGVNGGAKATSRLWVKSQQNITAGGKLYKLLELEGMWAMLREVLVRLGSPPFYTQEYSDTNAYTILETLLETEMSWTLDALGAQDDSIINTLPLSFDINAQPFEYMATVIYRLIRGTKCLLRSRAGLNFEIRFPQAGDSVDLTFYSDQAPYFYKYTDRDPLTIPNRIYTFGNAGADGLWSEYVTGDESDSASIDAYAEMADIYLAPDIALAANADLLSAALLSKIKAQAIHGVGTAPHHCAVEVLDKQSFVDNRVSQNTYPADGTVRVGGLRHIYRPGRFILETTVGGVSISGDIARSVGTQNIVFTDAEEKAITPPPYTRPPWAGPLPPREPGQPPVTPTGTPGGPPYPVPLKYPPAPAPSEITLVPTMPGIWAPREPGPPPEPMTIPEAIVGGLRAGLESLLIPARAIWRAITPWKEEAGETFVGEVRERFEAVTKWFGGLFR